MTGLRHGYSYTLNNPVKYIDPTGHYFKPIGGYYSSNREETDGGEQRDSYNGYAIYGAKKEPNIRLTGLGIRLDMTGGFLESGDINIDFVVNKGKVDILVTPGLETGVEGGGAITYGLLLIWNADDISDLQGLSFTSGADVFVGPGLEFEHSLSLSEDPAQETYIGVGGGAQAGFHANVSETISVFHLGAQVKPAYDYIKKFIQEIIE